MDWFKVCMASKEKKHYCVWVGGSTVYNFTYCIAPLCTPTPPQTMGWGGPGKATSANSRVPATCLAVWWWPCAGGWRPWWSRPPGCGLPHGTPSACWSQHPGSWSSLLDLLQQTKVTMPSHYREINMCWRERGKQTEDFLLGSTSSTHQFPSIKYKCILCTNLLSALADHSHLHAQHHLLPTVLHTLTHMHTV